MRIHHLNCGSHCPLGGRLFDGRSKGLFADICTHVLLLETDNGLVLVDTGYGLQDVWNRPRRRLAHTWPLLLNIRLREEDTALRQIEKLGFSADDVRHIVLTHLDFDHAGGIEDFPIARVHVLAAEKEAAERQRHNFVARQRYRRRDWDEVQDWRLYEPKGEAWNGFGAVRDLDSLPPEILMVPLRGHTLGHAGIAVAGPDGWLLHAGDAFLHAAQLQDPSPMPPGLALYDRIMTTDLPAARANRARLRTLYCGSNDVRIFCSHDTGMLNAMRIGEG